MIRDLITIAFGLGVGCWWIALLKLARTAGVQRAPRLAAFRPAPDGTRWIACHDTACGHMATRHFPQPDGSYRCEQWAQHRGQVHLDTTKEGRDA